ncbi:MAG: DUF308 domain-containing protein [bacterium]|nr:DUF308 domain-containing protein [bacterium]
MKDIINKITGSIIGSSIAAIVAALILIFAPNLSVATLGITAGILLIAWGLFMVMLEAKISTFIIPFEGMLVGVISIILGIALLSSPAALSIILLYAIGIWIIISSINNLKMAYALKKAEKPAWLKIALLAVLDLVIGTIVILNPFAAALEVTIFIGIMLLIHSILNLVDALMLRKDVKDLEYALKGAIQEAEIVEPKDSKKPKETKTARKNAKKDEN